MKNQIINDLQQGKIVTLPTETVFGYAVSLESGAAILDLMELKERDYNSGKVFTLVPTTKNNIQKYAIVPDYAKALITNYVPGEVTLLFPKNPLFRHFYFDHFNTVGIRIPDHPLFAEILPKTGPLLLTSANKKGGTPKSTTGHLPSTIIDCTGVEPHIVRQGNLRIDI